MFHVRLGSGIILLAIAIFFLCIGGYPLFIISILISLVGLYELYQVLGLQKSSLASIGYASTILYYILLYHNAYQYITFLLIATLMVLLVGYVLLFPKFKTEEIAFAFFSIFYVPILFSYLFQTRMMADGKFIVWLILISSWGSDTCAYAVGMLFGKHKIAPVLSPKKSVEGSIGGMLGAACIGLVFGFFVGWQMGTVRNPMLSFAIACAIGSVISQIGDAIASAIKRNHDIKDFGNLIPGHGGILDRFDSMLFTAPAVFYFMEIFSVIHKR